MDSFKSEQQDKVAIDAFPEGGQASPAVGDETGPGNIDKVRDILFGAQMRNYEARFDRLEERIRKEVADLREDTRQRIEALESFVKKELESLDGRVDTEKSERVDSVRELSESIKETAQFFENRTSQLDGQLSKTSKELREQILDQSKSLSEEIARKHSQANDAMEQATGRLRADKVDRGALSDLFSELSMRLTTDMVKELNLDPEALEDE